MSRVWVGADPGGEKAFGVATLSGEGEASAWCVDSAAEAVATVTDLLADGAPPLGIGVDTPLWWSSGPSGGRKADAWLRKTYHISSGTVQQVNSLRGAALAQGALFVALMRKQFPAVPVTESHPKALLKALKLDGWPAAAARFAVRVSTPVENDDQRDAILGAIAAREGFEGRWTRDLSLDRLTSEQDPVNYWLGPVHYWWPEPWSTIESGTCLPQGFRVQSASEDT